jgi:signal transduction histidine kinase
VAELREVEFRTEIPPRLSPLVGDPWTITQVLFNILHNAFKHTAAGGRVTLGARAHGEAVRIWVEDTGKGIRPEFLDRVFENRARDDDSGSGIGLFVSRNIVVSCGGRMWVDSVVGEGTTVSFTIPTATNLTEKSGSRNGAALI